MNIQFSEKFTDYHDACGWCIQQCLDEEKYEMLITCIRIQNSFAELSRDINLMLDRTSPDFLKRIIYLFERIAEFTQTEQIPDRSAFQLQYSEEGWKLPGCSQIFRVAQSLGKIHFKETDHRD